MTRNAEIEAIYEMIKMGPVTLGIREDGVGIISYIDIPTDGEQQVRFVPLAEIRVPLGPTVDE